MRRNRFAARPSSHDGLSVIAAYGNVRMIDMDNPLTSGGFMFIGRTGKNLIRCRDGFTLSVVAGPYMHCVPAAAPPGWHRQVRYDAHPYRAFEVARLSDRPQPWPLWAEYTAPGDSWRGIFGRVPLPLIRDLIDRHGGFHRFIPATL